MYPFMRLHTYVWIIIWTDLQDEQYTTTIFFINYYIYYYISVKVFFHNHRRRRHCRHSRFRHQIPLSSVSSLTSYVVVEEEINLSVFIYLQICHAHFNNYVYVYHIKTLPWWRKFVHSIIAYLTGIGRWYYGRLGENRGVRIRRSFELK